MADGYYGGSPMEPGISITLSFGRPYNSYNDHWNFVRARDFESRDIYRYFVDRSNHSRIIRNSTVINTTYIDNSRHTTYVTGPAREDVQRVTGRRISPVAIQENSRPGKDQNDGRLKMYRPQVIKNSQLERKPAPERVDNLNNVKRPSERKSATQPREINQKNNNDARPAQPRSVAPVDNKQQQQNSRQQQNDNRYQPGQKSQQAVSPTNNQRQQQQNNNIQQENKTRTQPSQEPQHVALVKNNEKLQQDNNFRQQDNTAQPAQQQQQQHQKQQQQPQQRTTPANTNQERQQIIQKQNNQQIREQAKEKKSEDEKKPNN